MLCNSWTTLDSVGLLTANWSMICLLLNTSVFSPFSQHCVQTVLRTAYFIVVASALKMLGWIIGCSNAVLVMTACSRQTWKAIKTVGYKCAASCHRCRLIKITDIEIYNGEEVFGFSFTYELNQSKVGLEKKYLQWPMGCSWIRFLQQSCHLLLLGVEMCQLTLSICSFQLNHIRF